MTSDDFPIQDSAATDSSVVASSDEGNHSEVAASDADSSVGAEVEPSAAPLAESSEVDGSSAELLQEVASPEATADSLTVADTAEEIEPLSLADLQRQKSALQQEIAALQSDRALRLAEQTAETKTALEQLVQAGVNDLEQRKQSLQVEVERLERRQERIRAEMRTSFAGVSQELAIRVKGFKDYLVGSLQDLAASAEQLELQPSQPPPLPAVESSSSRRDRDREPSRSERRAPEIAFADDRKFQEQLRQIRGMLDLYRTQPEYYGPPWQLRRTFEPIHAERVAKWFFSQGGRGATPSMGSRLQNILITSAVISILRTLYGDRVRTLVLANTPERLGEWRRGLQDCLGISRSDFGPDRGAILFEEAEPLAIKAQRLLEKDYLPFIAIDETEDRISLSILQFPLWLAFAPNPEISSSGYSGYSFER